MADDENKDDNAVGEVAKAVIVTDILANILTHKAADVDARGNPAPELKAYDPDANIKVTSTHSGSIMQWVQNSWKWFTGKDDDGQQQPGPAAKEALQQPDQHKSCGCGMR